MAGTVTSAPIPPELSRYVGKFVCYLKDDRFMFGKIENIGKVNTASGEQDVFIVSRRMSSRGTNGNGDWIVERHKGNSVLFVSAIDLDQHVSDKSYEESMSDEDLFLRTMRAWVDIDNIVRTGDENMSAIGALMITEEDATRELRRRMIKT